ncbi:hypothetical protein QJS10_CPA08g00478 [Acorus calamus]|uniref:Aminotransferase-like plant mobile domain-containing protein n=1 Tax=Acorus calamus TaxID=4465 RepID=A0AAV9EA67_ACOCL|nr:hypothetical protein QJS10_CPA08g00478 [Acorus calamus]
MDGMSVRPCHRRLMKKTPFNILINIPKMQFQSELLDVIVSSYNEDGDFFVLGGQPIYFTAEDIALIIGLLAFGETPKLDSSPTKSKIKSRFFSNNSMITRGALKDKMSSLVDSDNPRDIKYFVRLWIAFIFACFLFSIGHYNCLMSLLTILDDLNSMWNYACSVAIRNQIMEGVQKQRACITERNEGQYPKSSMGYVFGCTAVLCEHTRTNRWRPAGYRVSPRLFKWVMKLTRRRGEKDADPFRVKSNEGARSELGGGRGHNRGVGVAGWGWGHRGVARGGCGALWGTWETVGRDRGGAISVVGARWAQWGLLEDLFYGLAQLHTLTKIFNHQSLDDAT